MGSSLLMCKCTTLSTCNGSLKNRYPMPGGSATGSGHKRTGIPPGSCHTWKHKGQPCRLLFLPLDGERSGRTQVLGGVAAAPGRTECHPPPPPSGGAPGAGRDWGRGRRRLPSGSLPLLCLSFMISSSLLLPFTSRYRICCRNLIFSPHNPGKGHLNGM